MLRWLITVLLLLNLGLFAWGYLQPQPPQEFPGPLSDSIPTIRLVSEQEQPITAEAASGGEESRLDSNSSAAAPVATVQEQEQRPNRCLRLGPFEQQETAAAAAEVLGAASHDTRLQVKIERSQSGYWVLIPPGSEDPDFVIVNLELAGIQDLWRFEQGELAGAVSLGLYSDRKQAQARQGELRERGFDAEIRSRYMENPGYWIESSYAQGDEAAEKAMEQLYVEHHWLEYPPQECEEVATQ